MVYFNFPSSPLCNCYTFHSFLLPIPLSIYLTIYLPIIYQLWLTDYHYFTQSIIFQGNSKIDFKKTFILATCLPYSATPLFNTDSNFHLVSLSISLINLLQHSYSAHLLVINTLSFYSWESIFMLPLFLDDIWKTHFWTFNYVLIFFIL